MFEVPTNLPSGICSTHNITNKGLSGMRMFVARFNFSCILIGNRPQFFTGHTANRCSENNHYSNRFVNIDIPLYCKKLILSL